MGYFLRSTATHLRDALFNQPSKCIPVELFRLPTTFDYAQLYPQAQLEDQEKCAQNLSLDDELIDLGDERIGLDDECIGLDNERVNLHDECVASVCTYLEHRHLGHESNNAISCHQEPTTSSPTASQPEHCSPNSSICNSDEEHPLSTEDNAPGLKRKAHLSQKKRRRLKCQALATEYTPPPLYNPSSLCDSQSRANRRRKRIRHDKKRQPGLGPSDRTLKHVFSSSTALEIDADAAQFDAALGAQTGKPGQTKHLGTILQRQQMYHLADLLAEGFYHIKWDGYTPTPIVDCLG
ncbi:hypothetical protein GYMLUDRAFT_78475 [Collybiopsis luxurians FD-317 M1]|uniref:Uncharacterized protein n=1 Tax=Collybiopsis luxurians FD-317 M1 TaxID=944289 RepID=A0A0D0C746_9AGAR|nr:hypothetical protein GYMLUDRAFT_78475 [Collybiopsis luxurians FD-317 M1]